MDPVDTIEVTLDAAFHLSRTVPISDIVKQRIGRRITPSELYILDSLQFLNVGDSMFDGILEIDYMAAPLETKTITIDRGELLEVQVAPLTRCAFGGLNGWTMLRISAHYTLNQSDPPHEIRMRAQFRKKCIGEAEKRLLGTQATEELLTALVA